MLSFQNCDCVQVRKCQWSKNSLESVEVYQKVIQKLEPKLTLSKNTYVIRRKSWFIAVDLNNNLQLKKNFRNVNTNAQRILDIVTLKVL